MIKSISIIKDYKKCSLNNNTVIKIKTVNKIKLNTKISIKKKKENIKKANFYYEIINISFLKLISFY
jgi:hypothetical protein